MSAPVLVIKPESAPALGDIRAAGRDAVVYVSPRMTERDEWPRYWDAVGVAFARGARVFLLWEGENK